MISPFSYDLFLIPHFPTFYSFGAAWTALGDLADAWLICVAQKEVVDYRAMPKHNGNILATHPLPLIQGIYLCNEEQEMVKTVLEFNQCTLIEQCIEILKCCSPGE